jgi:hypothetical protein
MNTSFSKKYFIDMGSRQNGIFQLLFGLFATSPRHSCLMAVGFPLQSRSPSPIAYFPAYPKCRQRNFIQATGSCDYEKQKA